MDDYVIGRVMLLLACAIASFCFGWFVTVTLTDLTNQVEDEINAMVKQEVDTDESNNSSTTIINNGVMADKIDTVVINNYATEEQTKDVTDSNLQLALVLFGGAVAIFLIIMFALRKV